MKITENDISESFDRAKALEEKLGVMHILKGLKTKYDDCYSYMEDADEAVSGMCSGMICGTEETDYVLEKCIDCPYYVGDKGETKDEKEN